jgi:Amt family ammonium transporter
MGGVSLAGQVFGTLLGVVLATATGFVIYGLLKATLGIRLTAEEEYRGADLSIHHIGAYPEEEVPAFDISPNIKDPMQVA